MKSNTNHGIHSPFVYDLITTCFFSGSWTKEKHFITSKIKLKKNLFNLIRKLNNYILRYNVINQTNIVVFNLSLISNDHKEIEYLSLNNHQFIIIIENSHNFRNLVNFNPLPQNNQKIAQKWMIFLSCIGRWKYVNAFWKTKKLKFWNFFFGGGSILLIFQVII